MSSATKIFSLSIVLFLLLAGVAIGEEDPPSRNLIVGTKEAPPFAMKTANGEWSGISIDLWRQIAADLEYTFEFRELPLQALLDGVVDGSLDAVVAALTITSEREQRFDFTHPFYTTGLGIAVASTQRNPWLSTLKRFASPGFLKVAASLVLLLFGVGLLVWWFERKKNPQQFGGGTARGIGSGFWWSAVTMTTVGYGDKAPVSFGGRLLALVWMFAAIIIISSFTAAITSSLTVNKLESPIKGLQDLPKVRVGTLPDTTSGAYLEDNNISFRIYKTTLEGLRAIVDGQIDAFVYDAPLLRYLAHKDYKGIVTVLPVVFLRQDYGIALPAGSPLREPINRQLLQTISKPEWQGLLKRYLGE
jgi:polar amino acid transport system substrate-binding protein